MNRIFLTFLLSLALYSSSFAQDIEAALARYGSEFAQEKAYIHYDKASYSPGETIWYKVYIMEGPFPSESSKTFYLDWTDERGNLLGRNVSPIYEGVTNGQFQVPDSFAGRFIHARGYTRWMLNFDSTFLYNKDIYVLQKATKTTAPQADKYTLSFFPEGGDFVRGIVNKIAFKAHDQFGRPITIRGQLVNQAGKVIDSVRSQHDGMGLFFLTPDAVEKYTLRWKDPKGRNQETPLPVVKPHGIGLQVSSVRDRRYFQVNVSRDNSFDPGIIHLVGTLGGTQVFLVSKDSKAGEVKGVIPTGTLPSGLLTITAFDDQWRPMAERITFINNPDQIFSSSLEVKHWGLSKRARNEIEITLPDSLAANLSISITDGGIESDSSDNIISHLLLTGDLRGQVYKPGYYFSNNSDSVARHLDLVMLTHGWRRLAWEDLVKGKMPDIKFARDTSYFTLSGRVYGASPAEIKEAGEIILLVKPKDKEGGVVVAPLNADGSFNEQSMLLFDSTRVYHQFGKGKKMSSASVRYLENKLSAFRVNATATGKFASMDIDTTGRARHARFAEEEADLLRRFEGKLLEGVVVKATTKSPKEEMDEKYTSGLFSGGDAYSFDLVNDPLAQSQLNIFTYLQGKVAGLQVNGATSGSPSLQWRGGSPQLYLNEIQSDVDMISSINVTDVAYIKVFRPPFMGGFNGGNGAIAIYTRRGGDSKQEPGKGLASSTVFGYSEIRQFYSPSYASFQPEHEKKDLRTTLYWNPLLMTGPGRNKVLLTFYNNDISESFRVVIEGVARDGRLTRLEQIVE